MRIKPFSFGRSARLIVAALVCALGVCAQIASYGQDELREWTDSTGAYHIKATLISMDGSNVRLRREDGKLISMPISKLSGKDQEYVKQLHGEDAVPKLDVGNLSKWQAAAAQATSEEREELNKEEEQRAPKENRTPVKRQPRANGPFEINGKTITLETNGAEIYVGSFANAKRLNPATSPRTWKLKPQALETAIPDNYHQMTVIPKQRGDSYGVFYSSGSNFYVGFRSSGFGSFTTNGSSNLCVARCDVSQGTSEIVRFFFDSNRLYDVTKDGALALANIKIASQGTFLDDPFLAIIDLSAFVDGDERDPQAIFCPYYKPQKQQNNPPNSSFANLNLRDVYINVENASMIDSARILTKCGTEATLWDLRTCQAIYSIKCRNQLFAVDPTRSYFVLADSLGLGFYDVDTGETLGYVRVARDYSNGNPLFVNHSSIAFSPSGKKLAFYAFDHVNIIDLTSGKAINSFPIPNDIQKDMTWSSDDYLLLGNYCFDIVSGAPIVLYTDGLASGSYSRICLNNIVWSCEFGALNALTLPQDETISQTKGKSLSELFALYPGAAVSIKCELNGLLNENEVTDAIKKRLQLFGLKYDPMADVVLLATTKDSGEKEEATIQSVETRDFGVFRDSRIPPSMRASMTSGIGGKVTETKDLDLIVYRQSLAVIVNGKVVKEVSDLTVGNINAERDESKTIEQQVRELNKPDAEFYTRVSIPFYASKGDGGTAVKTVDLRIGVEEPK